MKTKMYYVYILERSDGSYYCGSTQNIDKRLYWHNVGSVQSTRHYRPLKLLFSKEYGEKTEAQKTERKLKKMKSRKIIEEFMSGLW
ncbi:MAG: GIY-YIG nuclease family protein [candidate division SR1 bacterium]|nr:GIY-YIG nuclease family protein [candidate division SR1 bacterium]